MSMHKAGLMHQVSFVGLLVAAGLVVVSATIVARKPPVLASTSATALRTVHSTAIDRKRRANASTTAVGTATALPVTYSFPVAFALGTAIPDRSPPGANDWGCRPSAAHPRPVVLVHGTAENMISNWNALSPLLANNGYCVFALNYGSKAGLPINALGPVARSAKQLRTFVDRVLAATGAAKVDIVGHSQGGMMSRQYLKFDGGASEVHTLVGLAPPNHGTSSLGLLTSLHAVPGASALLSVACEACNDATTGSPLIAALNAGGDTVPGVRYTVIATRRDEIITPYTSSFLSGPDVTNITVQDGCVLDRGEHLAISFDRRALTYVRNALDPAHPVTPPCRLVLPGVGG
jgi:triacylglycerol esterase/lipase EstA (alpha/beta hydrolase family)